MNNQADTQNVEKAHPGLAAGSRSGTSDGKVRVLAASTEIGQGTSTVFTQIACDALGLSPDMIEIATPDTKFVPNSGPTVASRTTMVVGKLVQDCCEALLKKLRDENALKPGHSPEELSETIKSWINKNGDLRVYCQYQQPPHINWDDKTYQGDAYGTYAWAVYVAEVAIDTITYQTRVENFVAVQEVGKVVNPVLAAGQIEGGVSQGIGYALFEKVVMKDGKMANNRMTNYIIPTASDYGPIIVEFAECPYPYGPRGAKGIGELPLDGAAPAIAAAIEFAIAKNINYIPFLPEDMMEALS